MRSRVGLGAGRADLDLQRAVAGGAEAVDLGAHGVGLGVVDRAQHRHRDVALEAQDGRGLEHLHRAGEGRRHERRPRCQRQRLGLGTGEVEADEAAGELAGERPAALDGLVGVAGQHGRVAIAFGAGVVAGDDEDGVEGDDVAEGEVVRRRQRQAEAVGVDAGQHGGSGGIGSGARGVDRARGDAATQPAAMSSSSLPRVRPASR